MRVPMCDENFIFYRLNVKENDWDAEFNLMVQKHSFA